MEFSRKDTHMDVFLGWFAYLGLLFYTYLALITLVSPAFLVSHIIQKCESLSPSLPPPSSIFLAVLFLLLLANILRVNLTSSREKKLLRFCLKLHCIYWLTWRELTYLKYWILRNSLVVQWLRLGAFTAEGLGSIPGQRTKIPQAMQPSQKTPGKWTKILSVAICDCGRCIYLLWCPFFFKKYLFLIGG